MPNCVNRWSISNKANSCCGIASPATIVKIRTMKTMTNLSSAHHHLKCELAALLQLNFALHHSLCQFHGHPHPLFLFNMRGGHATAASSFLCLAACSWCTQTETWGLCMTLVFLPTSFSMQEACCYKPWWAAGSGHCCHLLSLAVDSSIQLFHSYNHSLFLYCRRA